MKLSKKIFFCDLDKTLVDCTLEKSFLIHSTLNSSRKLHFLSNIFMHYFAKLFFRLFKIKSNHCFFYYNMNKQFIHNEINDWISSDRFSEIKKNKKILDQIKKKDILIILTNSPAMISEAATKVLFEREFFIFPSVIKTKSDRYHFSFSRKVWGSNKKYIASKILRSNSFESVGYGDSESDKGFVDICDSGEVGVFIF